MTDSDDKLLRRYRELSREEPPRALDDAILAASRRAVARPSWSRRFAAPVSIAAVLVLAFGVTLEMQREEPGIEYKEPARSDTAPVPAMPAAPPTQAPNAEVPPAATPLAKQAPLQARSVAAPAEKVAVPREKKESAPAASLARPAPEPFTPALQSAPVSVSPPPAPAPPAAMDVLRDANVAPAAPAPPAAPTAARVMAAPRAKAETSESAQAPARAPSAGGAPAKSVASSEPERELERIAKLREDHRDAEADKALAEFLRNYPGFLIPDATLARVRPR